MKKRVVVFFLTLCLAVLSSVSPFDFNEMSQANAAEISSLSNGSAELREENNSVTAVEEQLSFSQKLDVGNHISNGSFNKGTDSFSSSSEIPFGILTEADGNMYASVTFDTVYRNFTSAKTGLKAGTPYTFSFDYYIPADNPNQFVYGLSTIAGHPNSSQQIKPTGYAPYTITNLDTGAVVQTNSKNTSMIHYGSGTRTLAVDGVNRNNGNETGGWRQFSLSFTLSADAPTVYFYFMSYEQGKKADGVTPLPFIENKVIYFDNVNLKGLYNVSVSAEAGGSAKMEILDTSPTPGKVYEGGRVKFTATPTFPNAFTGWKDGSGTVVSQEQTYIARISDNTHLTATFIPRSGSGVITVSPGVGGTVSSELFGGTIGQTKSIEVQNGTPVTLHAESSEGKGFIAWINQNDSPVSYEQHYTFYANGPVTLKPLFDNGNGIYNGDFTKGTSGWKTYGDSASNVSMSVMSKTELLDANIPVAPSGHPALKLTFNRTDGSVSKRVQAYSDYTFKTENNTTYEVSAWVYSANHNLRLSFYVPTAQYPYQIDATNDFTYVGSGYNIGATQLAGSYKYLANNKVLAQNGTYSAYTAVNRSIDYTGNTGGWTKISMLFTTDGNANCVKNATVSVGIRSYSKDGIDYTSGTAYFTDISVKKFSDYHIVNSKKGGNVTVNEKVVLSSLDGTAQYGDLLTLNADAYEGMLFDGWFKDNATVPFTTQPDTSLFYTGTATYKAKYSYDTSVKNFQLGDFESVLEPNVTSVTSDGDINGDGKTDLLDVTVLSRFIAGWSNVPALQNKTDVTGDGVKDLRDVTHLSRLVAGWNMPGNNSGGTLKVWELLSESGQGTEVGSPLSWGSYNVTEGKEYSLKPHGGNHMLAVYGRGNYSKRQLDVTPNTNYMLTFYWHQNSGDTNALNSVAITADNPSIKIGSQAEYANAVLTPLFCAQSYTPIASNGSWQKYSLTFNSKNNSQLKLFIKYTADTSAGIDYLFLDDFSLLPFNTETASGSVTNLSVSNGISPLNNTFMGISGSVYHCYTYMNDRLGRNYTDEMAALEMDRLRDTGTKLIRTIFKSWFAWDDTKGGWNWESQRMQDTYRWAKDLQDRGLSIALQAGWSHTYLVTGESSIPEVPYLYANGDYTLACARYAEWMKQALQAFEAHGVYNISHLIVFTEPSRWTSNQLEGPHAAQYVQAINALDTSLRSAGIRDKYKLVGPNQGSIQTGGGLLNYALEHCDSAVDIYSTHFYPRSAKATDDVYGNITKTAYTSYMNVMKQYNSTKDFWSDEYFAAASDSPLGTDSAWCGTQTAVGMTSAMNAGIEGMISWQIFDQLWVDQTNTGGEFQNGIHACGTTPSLFISAVPRRQYYALTLMSKYFGFKNGKAYTSTAPDSSGVYISCAQLEDGSYTVMVVNAGSADKKVQVNFASAINQTLYRHLYDPDTIRPDARAKVIPADKVYHQVSTSLVDTVPRGGIAIYTGLGN